MFKCICSREFESVVSRGIHSGHCSQWKSYLDEVALDYTPGTNIVLLSKKHGISPSTLYVLLDKKGIKLKRDVSAQTGHPAYRCFCGATFAVSTLKAVHTRDCSVWKTKLKDIACSPDLAARIKIKGSVAVAGEEGISDTALRRALAEHAASKEHTAPPPGVKERRHRTFELDASHEQILSALQYMLNTWDFLNSDNRKLEAENFELREKIEQLEELNKVLNQTASKLRETRMRLQGILLESQNPKPE